MTICYFGIYRSGYSRSRVLTKGLVANGVTVIECNSRLVGFAKYIDLIKKHWKIRNDYETMIVGFPGYQAVILARILTRKKIIFDAFASLYDSMVLDRKEVGTNSLKSFYFWFLDWLSCRLADKILLDTNEHIKYFSKTFNVKENKFCRIFVGSDDEAVYPVNQRKGSNNFLVHFHGSCIPLQGIDYIIKAASLLKDRDIEFNIIGSKIKKKFGESRIKNINFLDNVTHEKLKYYMSEADVCLGVFGNTSKAKRVIPNKVFEGLAVKCPVITAETPAVQELLRNEKNVLFCKNADPKDLAEKILKLKDNKQLGDDISKNGYNLFTNNLIPRIVVKPLLNIL